MQRRIKMEFQTGFKEFGNLNIIDIYEFYDKPLLVSCKNELGHIYFALLVDDHNNEEIWLYVGVSENRFNAIRSGIIDLHDAFRESESDFVWIVKFQNFSFENPIIRKELCANLTDDILPIKGELLEIATDTLPKFKETVLEKSKQAKRVYARIKFDFPNNLRTEAPAKLFGEILVNTQDLLNSIQRSKQENILQNNVPLSSILASNELLVSDLGPGSFQVELVSAQFVNLFDDSLIEDSIGTLFDLIAIGSDPDDLRTELRKFKAKTASNYYKFLKSVSESADETSLEWASPKPGKYGKTRITKSVAQAAMIVIELTEDQTEKTIEEIGVLIGANLKKKTFEFEINERFYSGRVADQLLGKLVGSRLGISYKATIKHTQTIKSTTGESDDKYELLDLTDFSL